MIVERITKNEDVDLNIVAQISRIAKIDLVAKAEESKEYANLAA